MPWEKPKTIKLYLQPPACDRLITIWPDLKIVDQAATAPEGEKQDCFGVHLLFGPEAQAVPWEQTRWRVRSDGIPVPCLRAKVDDFRVEVEACCAWGREANHEAPPALAEVAPEGEIPPLHRGTTTLFRLTVTNEAAGASDFLLGMMPRTTPNEHYLWGIRADFYASYQPQQATWDWVRNTWTLEPGAGPVGSQVQGVVRDDGHFLQFGAPETAAATWRERPRVGHAAHGYLELATRVGAHQSQDFFFALGQGEALDESGCDYEARQAATVAHWEEVLGAVRIQPAVSDGDLREMYWSLLAQSLQMLALDYEGLIRPRQGGGCPFVWPWEAVEFLTALDRVGLGSWVRLAYQFFKHHQITEGEGRGRYAAVGAPNWYGHTGGVLRGLGTRLIAQDCPDYFASWRESVLAAVDWVEGLRAQTKAKEPGLGWGLMAAGPGHDWEVPAQYWCFTDAYTYLGLREIARAFRHFDDPEAARLEAAADEYEQALRRTLEQVIEGQEDRDDVYIPNQLGAAEAWPPNGPYFADGPVNLIRAGIIDPKSELFERVERHFQNQGWMRNGLTGLMTDGLFSWGRFFTDPWAGHTWYIGTSDMCWFYGWLARGERTKAARTLRAQFLYGMTPEYYLAERFADNDPTFCPWQPNASANGRTIMMVLDFYGEEAV